MTSLQMTRSPMPSSLVPRPHMPSGEKRSGERSQIPWAYYPKRVMTNEIVKSVILHGTFLSNHFNHFNFHIPNNCSQLYQTLSQYQSHIHTTQTHREGEGGTRLHNTTHTHTHTHTHTPHTCTHAAHKCARTHTRCLRLRNSNQN